MTDYYVDPLWPKRRLNLTAGASGAGKTRYVLPQLFALQEGKPIDGKPTEPTKVAYVCCDRTVEDAQSTMEELGLDPRKMPTYSFMDNGLEWEVNIISRMIPADTELVFIEAIAALVPGGDITSYHGVLRLGRKLNAVTKARKISFWGSTHTPKLKKGESWTHTRENVIGSAAWAGISGTIVCIDEISEEGIRQVTVMLRNQPQEKIMMEFDATGHLIPCDVGLGRAIMDNWLKQLPPGTDLSTEQIEVKATQAKVSRATAQRWIKEKVTEGWLLFVQRGWYRTRPQQ